jgi:hypothetical protein
MAGRVIATAMRLSVMSLVRRRVPKGTVKMTGSTCDCPVRAAAVTVSRSCGVLSRRTPLQKGAHVRA